MIFKHAVPILYSADVLRSLTYYVEVLGFENKWEWENPPLFGGVSKDSVEIFFCEKAQGNPGTWLCVMVDNIDEFYETVKSRGAKILAAPENMEWGLREMLVEDPDGHIIRFGQNAIVSDREKSALTLPQSVRIIARVPAAKEIQKLALAIGWSSSADEGLVEKPSPAVAYAVVAEDSASGEMIGCAFLLSDQPDFFYVRNLMVHPGWQAKRVGTALMEELNCWLQFNAPDKASVYLHTPENLAPFYRQFGFVPAFGMYRQIRRIERDK